MNGFSLLVCLTMIQLPSIQVTTLPGEQIQGTMEAFAANAITVKSESESRTIPFEEVLLIRSANLPTTVVSESPIEIRLVDGTRLRCNTFTSAGAQTTITHNRLGEFQIPKSTIVSVRFAPLDAKVDSNWNQFVDRTIKKDVVVVRKGDVLDHLDGIIGTLNEAMLQFQMDGDEIPIKREKVFGLIFSKRESTAKKAIARLDLVTGDRFAIRQIEWNESKWKIRLVSGTELEIAPELFQTLDYSLGKVAYLSDIEPRTKNYKPEFDDPRLIRVYEPRRDQNFEGGPISLGDQSFAKGLALHSQTLVMYRVAGEFRKFQAVMGIGDEVPYGDVDVVIKGDGKTLFKNAVKALSPGDNGSIQRATPQLLDLDIAGVVELEIFVDYGSDARDQGDRLYLGNARVVK